MADKGKQPQKDEHKDGVKKDDNTKDGTKKEDEKLEYDPEDDVWALDEGKASPGRKYALSVVTALRPLVYLGGMIGLFPLTYHRFKDGSYSCKFSCLSVPAIIFLILGIVVIGSTFWMLLSIICAAINIPEHLDHEEKPGNIFRSEEIYVYKRNTLALVISLASFIHVSICMSAIFLRREYIAKQFVYWTEVVELLHLNVGKDVEKTLWRHVVVLFVCIWLLGTIYLFNLSPGISGAGSMLYMIFTRLIDPMSHWDSDMGSRKLLFSAYLILVIFMSYIYLLWFFFNCRILTNILKIWNNRFEFCLHKHILELAAVRETREGTREANRTSRAHLFNDHLVIFNLLEGINTQFEIIIESYYLSTMVMIVFEAYGFVHAFKYAEYQQCGSRSFDIFPISIMLGLQMYFYITVTLEAAGVADEARHVLDIVRRKGMMTSRADNELWFMMSMRLSFGGHEDVGIIGAGFFYITKAFLLGSISAMMSHFIIFYQFEVPYAQTSSSDPNLVNLDTAKLLKQLEGVPDTKC